MPESQLYAEFDVDPALGLAFVDALLLDPPPGISTSDFVELVGWRRGLAETVQAAGRGSTPGLPVRARTLLTGACQQASKANADWASGPTSALSIPSADTLASEVWKALFGWTNWGGTGTGGALLIDSLLHSVPVNWRVKLQGGTWELYDANASARRHAFGKADKLKYPSRMKLRARGASLKWVPGGHTTNGAVRVAANGAKSVGEAFKIAEVNKIKLIPKVAHDALPVTKVLGHSVLGGVLTFVPQMFDDARDAGLFKDPTKGAHWRKFAVNSATNQTANAAGMAAAIGAGALIGAASAPVAILVGIGAGVMGQASFNAFGLSKACGEGMDALIGYLSN